MKSTTILTDRQVILSIIIPVYNCEKYISDCLDSMTRQNFNSNDYEVLVINDGSMDGTREIVKRYTDKYDYIHCLDKVNGGVSSARNLGIKVSRGQYITFVDADDYVVSNIYKSMISFIENNNLGGFYFNNTNNNDLDKDFQGEILTSYCSTSACCVIYKKELLMKHNVFFSENIHYGEDFLFNYKFTRVCNKKVGYTKCKYYFVRNNNESVTHTFVKQSKGSDYKNVEPKFYTSMKMVCKEIKNFTISNNYPLDAFYKGTLSAALLALLWGTLLLKMNSKFVIDDLAKNELYLKDITVKNIEGHSFSLRLKSHIQYLFRKPFFYRLFSFLYKSFLFIFIK